MSTYNLTARLYTQLGGVFNYFTCYTNQFKYLYVYMYIILTAKLITAHFIKLAMYRMPIMKAGNVEVIAYRHVHELGPLTLYDTLQTNIKN